MPLLNIRKQYGHLYKPSPKTLGFVDVPRFRFLMIDGEGGVGGEAFRETVGTLMALAYGTKFAAKKQLDLSYQVMPLEGIYRTPDGPPGDSPVALESMSWQLMSFLPPEVSGELVEEVRVRVAAKKNPPRLDEVRVQTLTEGRCVQATHIGPYSTEPETMARMTAFIEERGYEMTGDHHEIYWGAHQRLAPEKLKTILRHPVREKA